MELWKNHLSFTPFGSSLRRRRSNRPWPASEKNKAVFHHQIPSKIVIFWGYPNFHRYTYATHRSWFAIPLMQFSCVAPPTMDHLDLDLSMGDSPPVRGSTIQRDEAHFIPNLTSILRIRVESPLSLFRSQPTSGRVCCPIMAVQKQTSIQFCISTI